MTLRPPAAINILTSEPSHMTTPGRLIMWLHVIHESRPELPTTDAMTETPTCDFVLIMILKSLSNYSLRPSEETDHSRVSVSNSVKGKNNRKSVFQNKTSCLTSTLSSDVARLSLAFRTPVGDESEASALDGGESSESQVSAASGLLRRP